VLGGTGGIGRTLVGELAPERPVRAVARHAPGSLPEGVDFVEADAETGRGLDEAVRGAEVVVNALNPPYHEWPERFPPMNRNVIRAASGAGCRLLFVDNLYCYGPQRGPLTEDLPRATRTRKGRVRIELENDLMEAHEQGRVAVSIARLSDYYGPDGPGSVIPALLTGPAAAGKKMRWPGSLEQPHTLHFLPDVARGLSVLAGSSRADGEVWHLPSAPAVTGREFTDLINARLPQPVGVGKIGKASLRIGGIFSRDAREMVELIYQWEMPFVSDSSKFERSFGEIETTPHDEAVRLTLEATAT
jgi:nucleoside-diphosphate-sugar epimerase